jgi:hypothetical protein
MVNNRLTTATEKSGPPGCTLGYTETNPVY